MSCGESLRIVSVELSLCAQTVPPLAASATALCKLWLLPERSSSSFRAASMLPGLARMRPSKASTWSAPMTKAHGTSPLTASALARASTSATSCGPNAPVLPIAWRMICSSRPGGWTAKARPAASSRRARTLLDEARIRRGFPLCKKSLMRATRLRNRKSTCGRSPSFEHRRSAVMIEAQDGGGGFLDRAARDVDHRPSPPGAELTRRGDLGRDRLAIDIGIKMRSGMFQHAVLADLRDALGACHEADDKSIGARLELRRQLHAWDERHIGGLVTAIGEIDAGRRLRGAADANQKNVGIVEILRQMAVVMQHGEVESLDAPEIIRIEHVLPSDRRR